MACHYWELSGRQDYTAPCTALAVAEHAPSFFFFFFILAERPTQAHPYTLTPRLPPVNTVRFQHCYHYSTCIMQFGASVGTACASFAITNIDDMFVLVTFFAEASTSASLTPLKITLGQYIGFTVIIIISMIGFGASLLLPSEPIGFLGFLPILLGVWKLFGLLLPTKDGEAEKSNIAAMKNIFKVSTVTVMNGGDNIGTYVPLFSQAQGAEIAVYVVTYYILLGVWCLAAFLFMKQKHILFVFQRYADMAIPLLYVGLGVYILVKSSCYPWAIEHIDDSASAHPGETIMAVTTTFLLSTCIGAMVWFKLRKKAAQPNPDPNTSLVEDPSPTAEGVVGGSSTPAWREELEPVPGQTE